MNLRVLGVPEDSERDQCPLKFMSELLVKALIDKSFTKPPELERCHRADGRAKPSTRPCFHHYQERERQLSNEVLKILIFPDFSARLMAKRSTFKKVKAQLHKKDIKFSL